MIIWHRNAYDCVITNIIINKRLCIEEAIVEYYRKYKIGSFSLHKKILEFYEKYKKNRKSKNRIKNKADYKKFMEYYKQAKKDMKEKGTISRETIEMIFEDNSKANTNNKKPSSYFLDKIKQILRGK